MAKTVRRIPVVVLVAELGVVLHFHWFHQGFILGLVMLAMGFARVLLCVPFSTEFICRAWYSALLLSLPAFDCGIQRFLARLSQNCGATRLTVLFSCANASLLYYIIVIAKGNLDWLLILNGFSVFMLSYLSVAVDPKQASELGYGFIPVFTMAAYQLYRVCLPHAAAVTICPAILAVSSLLYFAATFKLRRGVQDSLAEDPEALDIKKEGQPNVPSNFDVVIRRHYFLEPSSTKCPQHF